MTGVFFFIRSATCEDNILLLNILDMAVTLTYYNIRIRYRITIHYQILQEISHEGGEVMSSELVRDFFLGFIKLHILHHAGKEPVYVMEFKDELKKHGYDFSFGTLYPIFHKLSQSGYLEQMEKNVNGKIRKYYQLTTKGQIVLDEAKVKAKELLDEVF